ncbi:hypothetical protein FQZ97_758570 [compost metagenome]
MRLAEPSTRVEKVSAGLRRDLGARGLVISAGARSGSSASTWSCTVRGAGDVLLGPSRGASANSSVTGVPWMASSSKAIRDAYWARIQSSLKRLATDTTTLDASADTLAESGRIQVLNCCSGISCASLSTQASQRDWASVDGVSGGVPSIMLGKANAVFLWTNDSGQTGHCSVAGDLSTRRFSLCGDRSRQGLSEVRDTEKRPSACRALILFAIIAGFPDIY